MIKREKWEKLEKWYGYGTPQALSEMLELDFSKRRGDQEQEYSLEDKEFLKIKVSQEIRHTKDCHHETPLPFQSDHLWFPENKE